MTSTLPRAEGRADRTTGWVWHEQFAWHDTGNLAGIFQPGGYVQPGSHVETGEPSKRLAGLLQACGFDQYLGRIEAIAAVARFKPELVLVSCGYDANFYDPMAHMLLTSFDYAEMASAVLEVADACAGGRVVVVQEGGYSPFYVPFCGLAVLEVLSAHPSGVDDPAAAQLAPVRIRPLLAHQEEVITASRDLVSLVPS
ncbi:MAG: hypothetical protein ACRD0Z_10610 [Acidimicrobiales bacterium]